MILNNYKIYEITTQDPNITEILLKVALNTITLTPSNTGIMFQYIHPKKSRLFPSVVYEKLSTNFYLCLIRMGVELINVHGDGHR